MATDEKAAIAAKLTRGQKRRLRERNTRKRKRDSLVSQLSAAKASSEEAALATEAACTAHENRATEDSLLKALLTSLASKASNLSNPPKHSGVSKEGKWQTVSKRKSKPGFARRQSKARGRSQRGKGIKGTYRASNNPSKKAREGMSNRQRGARNTRLSVARRISPIFRA